MKRALRLSPSIWRNLALALSLASITMVSADCAKAQGYPKDPVHYFVTGVYLGVLGRQPDPAGWMYWVGPNDNLVGLTQANVSNYFMTSTEYCSYFGVQCVGSPTQTTNPPTDSQFLSLLYSRALNEPNASSSDPNYDTWLGRIPTLTRAGVVDAFIAPTQNGQQSQFDKLDGPFANSYCAGYSTPASFTNTPVTVGQSATITVTFANNACGGADMSNGQVIIGPSAAAGCDLIWSYNNGYFYLYYGNNNCSLSGGGISLMPNGNLNQASVNIIFTVLSSSLVGAQEVSSFAFDNQGVGNLIPTNLGSITVSAAPSVTLTNTSRTNSNSTFYVGDSYSLTLSGPPNQPVTLNYTLNGLGSSGLSEGMTNASGVFTLSGTEPSANIGSWTEQWFVGGVAAAPVLSFSVFALPAVQLSVSPYTGTTFQVGDSYTFTVTGPPSQPVTMTLNGTNSPMGSTNAQGTLTIPGTWGAAGNYTETWYVGGVAATPVLTFSVLPTAGANQGPGSFTASANPITCNDVTGSWQDTLPGASGANPAQWNLTWNGSSVGGNLQRTPFTECGLTTYSTVSGSLNQTNNTFTITASNPSNQYNCNPNTYQVATSITESLNISGNSCSVASVQWSAVGPGEHGSGSSSWQAATQHYVISMSDYIPVDHVLGPTPCLFNGSIPTNNQLLYLGDAYRGTYRTTQSILSIPDARFDYGFYANTGATRNYGAGSPANGLFANLDSHLVSGDIYTGLYGGADEDNVQFD